MSMTDHAPYSSVKPGMGGAGPYKGDLYDPESSFADIAAALAGILRTSHPGETFKITRRTYALGRTLEVAITTSDKDLSVAEVRRALCTSVADQAERFGYDRSSYEVDMVDRHYALDVEVSPDYWSERQAASGVDHVESTMSPNVFMKTIRKGHRLREVGGDRSGRTYGVKASSATRFVTDDGLGGIHDMSWKTPRPAALRTDGRFVRISMGTQNKPDEHRLLEWFR